MHTRAPGAELKTTLKTMKTNKRNTTYLPENTVIGSRLNYGFREDKLEDGSLWVGIQQWDRHLNFQGIWIQKDLVSQIAQRLAAIGAGSPGRIPRRIRSNSELVPLRRCGKPWESGEEAQLVSLYLDDHSGDEIAFRLGRSSGAVTARLEKLGIVPDWKYYNL